MMPLVRVTLFAALYAGVSAAAAVECPRDGLGVLPIVANADRSPSTYLISVDGRVLAAIDAGAGAADSLARQPALNVLLLSALRVEQTADLPRLVESYQQSRHVPLTVYGPPGSRTMPSTTTFVRTLFDGTRGAFRYLGDVVSPLSKARFRLNAHDVTPPRLRPGVREVDPTPVLWQENGLSVRAAPTGTGALPSLAWRVQTAHRSVVVLDTAMIRTNALATLLEDADLVIAKVRPKTGDAPLFEATELAAMMHVASARELVLANVPPVGETVLNAIRKSYTGAVRELVAGACVIPADAANNGSASLYIAHARRRG